MTAKKKGRKKKHKNHTRKFILKSIIAGILFAILASGGLILLVKWGYFGHLPREKDLRSIDNIQASEIYSGDGKLLGKYYVQDRKIVEYKDIAPWVIKALVATEDVRFYEHHGIDWPSMFRVFFKSVLLGDESSGGGSTITQQLAKNLFPRKNYRYLSLPINKIREMIIATRLEQFYSKEDIITLYLNTIPFGENVFGIESAGERYFQKDAKDLNAQEAAVLVGMLKATTYYNPRLSPDHALVRRNVVIGQMVKASYLSEIDGDSLKKLPLKIDYRNVTDNEGPATYFREYMRQKLSDLLPVISDSLGINYNLYTDGLKIYTTLNATLQQYAENAVNVQMAKLQQSFDDHWKGRAKPWENDASLIKLALNQVPQFKQMIHNGVSQDSLKAWMNTSHSMEVFSWDGPKTVNYSPLDSVKYYLQFLNAGLLAIDPPTGQIIAWVGGINFKYFKYDHVSVNSKRQVGSTFKPIVYAAALDHDISPCQYIKAEQQTYQEKDKEWKPANANSDYEGKYSLEGALTESVNTVSVKILEQAGIDNVIDLAENMGITSEIPAVPSIALGTPSISLMEMVTAYCAFVNRGNAIQPYCITRIENSAGQVIWKRPKRKTRNVMTVETSQMMLEMLKNVVNHGTAVRIRSTYQLSNDIAGKTGTTQNNADGWFIGMMPRLVVGTWVGGEYPAVHFRTTSLGQGANTALPIYAQLIMQLNKDGKYRHIANARFPVPPDYVLRELDCDPFKEDMNFFEMIFGKKREVERHIPLSNKQEKKGLFKSIKDFFSKKRN